MGVHDASIPSRRAMGSASNRKSVGRSSTLLSRPSGGIAESIGARQVSWLATYRRRRLPRPMKKSSGEKSVGTPLTVAGAATDRRKAYRVPFSPSGVIEGPCAGHVPASRGVVKWSADRFRARRSQRTPPPTAQSSLGAGSKHRRKTRPDFGGQIFERFGRRTSRPEQRSQLPQRGDLGFCDDRAAGSGRSFQLPLKDSLRRTAFRRIGAPFRAATGRVRPERRPMAELASVKNRKIWR